MRQLVQSVAGAGVRGCSDRAFPGRRFFGRAHGARTEALPNRTREPTVRLRPEHR